MVSMLSPRLIRFTAQEDNEVYYGEPLQSGDLGLLYHARSPITARVLSASPLSPLSRPTTTVRTVKKLLSPLAASEIKTIRGLGAQYGPDPNVAVKKPDVPLLFFKPASTITNPEDPIYLPEQARGMNNDYEVELCVVMGKDAKDVSVENALEYVLGYCTSNDVSSRSLCAKGLQWGVGKSFDSWCPIGPVLVSPKLLNPQALDIRTTVNGQLKQETNTRHMVLSVAELIASMSQGVTIEAGSIILTGTPLPLNRAADKDPWLKHGDEVRVFVEGCGTLINKVVEIGGTQIKAKL